MSDVTPDATPKRAGLEPDRRCQLKRRLITISSGRRGPRRVRRLHSKSGFFPGPAGFTPPGAPASVRRLPSRRADARPHPPGDVSASWRLHHTIQMSTGANAESRGPSRFGMRKTAADFFSGGDLRTMFTGGCRRGLCPDVR
jgi:hypothetical protein